MSHKISIGIPTYNGWSRVHDLLLSIRQRTNTNIPYDIFVVDDSGSHIHAQQTIDTCRQFDATPIIHSTNRGVPAGWNTLVRNTDADFMVLLNDDIIVANNWLDPLWYALQNNPSVGSFGLHCWFITSEDVPVLIQSSTSQVIPLDVRYRGSTLIRDERFPNMPSASGAPGRVMCPTGCAFGFRREVWEMVGGFDERYFCFYEESLPGYEYVLIRDNIENTRLVKLEDLYNESISFPYMIENRNRIEISGIDCLSAKISKDPSLVFLTMKERQSILNNSKTETANRANSKLDNSLSIEGCWEPITAIVRHKRSNKLLHVSQKNGSIYVTENHSMVLPKEDGFNIVKPEVFTSEDVPRARRIPLFNNKTKIDLGSYINTWEQYAESETDMWYLGYDSNRKPNTKRISTSIARYLDLNSKLGEDFCWLLGFHVAEGSVSEAKTNYGQLIINITCNSNISLVTKTQNIWEKVIGTKTYIVESKGKKKEYKNIYKLMTGHKLIGKLLMTLCGTGARNKQIPDFIYDAPLACKESFLEGFKNGDGLTIESSSNRIESKPTFCLTTTSRKLATGLSILLSALEKEFSIYYSPKKDSYNFKTKNHFNGHRDTKIVDLAVDQSSYVYDLEVLNTHVFCAGVGPVVVHNTDFGVECAFRGLPAFQLSEPGNYHIWSKTFSTAPEIDAGSILNDSRKKFVTKWSERLNIKFNDAPDIHNLLMDKIPLLEIKWLDSSGTEHIDMC